jgi:hypothetical protein
MVDDRTPQSKPISRRFIGWLLAVAIVSPMVTAGAGFVYTNYVQSQAQRRNDDLRKASEQKNAELRREQDMRWCRLFNLYVDPDQPPPTTDRGKEQLKEFLILYKSLGCHKP